MKVTLSASAIMFFIVFIFCSCEKDTDSNKTQNNNIATIEIDENTFIANDIVSLQEGVQALRNKTKTKLYLENIIECDNNSSAIVLDGLSDVIIFGNSDTTTGILRTGAYSENNLLILRSCSNITLQDIVFDELDGKRYVENYPSTIWIDESTDIRFNRVTVKGSKGVIAVGVYESTNFSIYKSHIEDVGAFGLWVDKTTGLLVQECTFKDNRSNALFIENVYGKNWDDNLVVGNNFEHNHCDAVFNVCDGPCPGGQLDIMNASYLTIKDNNIYDGKIETYPDLTLYSCGIELNDANHMLIEGNTFWNNTGSDLYMNSGHTLTEVYVKNNSFESGNEPCTRNMEQAIMTNNTCD